MERRSSRIQEKSKVSDESESDSILKERKKPQRPLNDEEKKQLRSFLIDLENYYRKIEPEITNPALIWQNILEDLRYIFRKTKDLFNEFDIYDDSEEAKVAKEIVAKKIIKMKWVEEEDKDYYNDDLYIEWRKIILYLFKHKMTNIDPAINYLKKVHEDRIKNLQFKDVIPDANLRFQIFKHLSYEDYLKTIKKRSLKDLSDDESWDLIMLLNDPSSKMFESLLNLIRTKNYDDAYELIHHKVNIKDASGKIIGTKSFDVNTYRKDGNTVLVECITSAIGTYFNVQFFELLKYLIDLETIDLFIPCKVKIGEDTILKGNAFSYALYGYYYEWYYYAKNNYLTNIYLYMLKKGTRTYKNKIPQFYVNFEEETPKCSGKYYGVVQRTLKNYDKKDKNAKDYVQTICIDNIWILLHVPIHIAEEFITKGELDLTEGREGKNVENSLDKYIVAMKEEKYAMYMANVRYNGIYDEVRLSENQLILMKEFLRTYNPNRSSSSSSSSSSSGGGKGKGKRKKSSNKAIK